MATDIRDHIDDPEQTRDDAELKATDQLAKSREKAVAYQAIGSGEHVELSVSQTRRFLTHPTKSGVEPTTEDVVRFLKLCEARRLNPWVGDAVLVGYDTKDGAKFELITTYQALATRAESHPEYDGIECGVIVSDSDGKTHYRDGCFVAHGEVLVGAWANVHRKDRSHPFKSTVNLSTFDRGRATWKTHTAEMILKCAKASGQREAFPGVTSGLYTQEERVDADAPVQIPDGSKPRSTRDLIPTEHRMEPIPANRDAAVTLSHVPPTGESDVARDAIADDAQAKDVQVDDSVADEQLSSMAFELTSMSSEQAIRALADVVISHHPQLEDQVTELVDTRLEQLASGG